MNQNSGISKIVYIVVFVLAVAIDQITKNIAQTMLDPGENVNVIGDVFQFAYTENYGAAFGMMQNKQTWFYIITGLVILFIIYFIVRMPMNSKYVPVGIVVSVILAGAVGNLIDRVAHKYVVDFIYFRPIDFPVFNVADIYVTLGMIIFVILVIFVYKDRDFDFLDPRKKNDSTSRG